MTVTRALWTHPIDASLLDIHDQRRNEPVHNLAAVGTALIVAVGGALVALNAGDGATVWHTVPAHFDVPVVVGDVVVAVDGAQRRLRAFSVQDGFPQWSVGVMPGSFHPRSQSYDDSVTVDAVQGGVLVESYVPGDQPYQKIRRFAEFDAYGARRWAATEGQGSLGRLVATVGDRAFIATTEDGASLHDVVTVIQLGPGGGAIHTFGGIGPLTWPDADGAWYNTAWPIGSAKFALTYHPRAEVDPPFGERESIVEWTFSPDQLPSVVGFGDASIEADAVYGAVHGAGETGLRLYRYALAPPLGQRPILLASDVDRWIAGPDRGWNIVERAGALWALRLRDDGVERVRLAQTALIDATAFDGHRLFIADDDGRVIGFDLDAETTILDAHTDCTGTVAGDAWRGIGVHRSRIIAVCAQRIYAFAQPLP